MIQSQKYPSKRALRKSVSLPSTPLSGTNIEDDCPELNLDKPVPYRGLVKRSHFNSTVGTDSKTRSDKVVEFVGLSPKDLTKMMDSVPALSKSRTQKFHKLFKTVPDNEYPVDYFSCAYIGDILLQGNLYVSQNWFCFYSRIRGRGRLLEIPMDSVISITREKTAIIFPNAIGLQTKKEKFAFGSFMSRDSTYKFLLSMWRKSQEARTSEGVDGTSERIRSDRSSSSFGQDSVFSNRNSTYNDSLRSRNLAIPNSTQSHSNSKTDSTDNSDSSICIDSGSVDASDNNDEEPSEFVGKTDSTSSPTRKSSCRSNRTRTSVVNRENKSDSVRNKNNQDVKGLQFPYSVIHCIDREKTMEAFRKSALKLQRIPRTNLLLAICTFLVLFLLLSAIGLTYKILNLEATLSSKLIWTDKDHQTHRETSYHNIFDVEMSVRESTTKHMQNILSANLRMLEEINTSLHDLKLSADKLHPEKTGQCEGC
ncbi:hypothetical protein ACF0H5_012805 [Mactra antiquata]